MDDIARLLAEPMESSRLAAPRGGAAALWAASAAHSDNRAGAFGGRAGRLSGPK